MGASKRLGHNNTQTWLAELQQVESTAQLCHTCTEQRTVSLGSNFYFKMSHQSFHLNQNDMSQVQYVFNIYTTKKTNGQY